MKRMVILISGRGSNMSSVISACQTQGWDATVAAVVSNRAEAKGLQFAEAAGVPTAVVESRLFATRESFEAVLTEVIDPYEPDLIVLAGFMRVLTASFVTRYMGRLINIHPSLLPSFKGLKTHQQALAAGVCVHGATVHFVTPELDHGPIIAQGVVPVLAGDDEASLAARVLTMEHRLYPAAIFALLQGHVCLTAQGVQFDQCYAPFYGLEL